MIYEFFYPWSHKYEWASAFNVLRYTPFRAIMATITAMLMSFFVAPARRAGIDAHFAENSEQALGILLSRLQPKDVVLVKASRGVRAERLVRGLCDAKGHAA